MKRSNNNTNSGQNAPPNPSTGRPTGSRTNRNARRRNNGSLTTSQRNALLREKHNMFLQWCQRRNTPYPPGRYSNHQNFTSAFSGAQTRQQVNACYSQLVSQFGRQKRQQRARASGPNRRQAQRGIDNTISQKVHALEMKVDNLNDVPFVDTIPTDSDILRQALTSGQPGTAVTRRCFMAIEAMAHLFTTLMSVIPTEGWMSVVAPLTEVEKRQLTMAYTTQVTEMTGSKPPPFSRMDIHKVIMRERLSDNSIFEDVGGAGVRVKKVLRSGATLLAGALPNVLSSSELQGWCSEVYLKVNNSVSDAKLLKPFDKRLNKWVLQKVIQSTSTQGNGIWGPQYETMRNGKVKYGRFSTMSKVLEITTLVEGMARMFLSGIATFNACFVSAGGQTVETVWFTVNLTTLISHIQAQKSGQRNDYHSEDGFIHMVNGAIFIRLPVWDAAEQFRSYFKGIKQNLQFITGTKDIMTLFKDVFTIPVTFNLEMVFQSAINDLSPKSLVGQLQVTEIETVVVTHDPDAGGVPMLPQQAPIENIQNSVVNTQTKRRGFTGDYAWFDTPAGPKLVNIAAMIIAAMCGAVTQLLEVGVDYFIDNELVFLQEVVGEVGGSIIDNFKLPDWSQAVDFLGN